MVVGKLLMVGIVTSLTACGASNSYYRNMSTAEYQNTNTVYDVVVNWSKHTAYDVPTVDKHRHERCVYFALDTLNLGEECEWHGQGSSGMVRVVQIEPNTCRTLFSSLYYKGRHKTWQESACYQRGKWKFFH